MRGKTMLETKSSTSTAPDLWVARRERLERDRAELLAQAAPGLDDASASATTGLGETEHIAAGIDRSVWAALDAHAAARLVEVNDALRRLDAGTYGRCERCESEIARARLDAIPEVRLCLQCQRREGAERDRRRPQ
jgi:RNA polymerase-binding transcription factor DksA